MKVGKQEVANVIFLRKKGEKKKHWVYPNVLMPFPPASTCLENDVALTLVRRHLPAWLQHKNHLKPLTSLLFLFHRVNINLTIIFYKYPSMQLKLNQH